MACRLWGAKPLLEPMMTHCQLDHKDQTSVQRESKLKKNIGRKRIWKCRRQIGSQFDSALMCLLTMRAGQAGGLGGFAREKVSNAIWKLKCALQYSLTHKQLETHGFILSIVAIDDLVLCKALGDPHP